jgi:hypothetical protein
MKTKTFIITYTLAQGEPIRLVVGSTGRNRAVRLAEPLFRELAQSRCIHREVACLG